MTPAVTVTSPKMQARNTREEAKVVRSMNFPVPMSVLSPVREAKLCPTVGASTCSRRPIGAWFSAPVAKLAAILAKMLFANIFRLFVRHPSKSENQVRGPGFPKD